MSVQHVSMVTHAVSETEAKPPAHRSQPPCLLTGVFEVRQEAELTEVSSEGHEEHSFRCNDQGKTIVA